MYTNTSWSKEQTTALIKQLAKYPPLYDKSHPLFTHKIHRQTIIRAIIENLKPIKPNINAGLISKKMKCLKYQFLTEKKKMKKGLKTPNLWCYEMLRFFEKKRKYNEGATSDQADDINSETNGESLDESSNFEEDYEIEEEEVKTNRTERQKEPRDARLKKTCVQLMESISHQMKNVQTNQSAGGRQLQVPPNTFLGRLVESELLAVSEDVYLDAKWKIIRILEEASNLDREIKARQN